MGSILFSSIRNEWKGEEVNLCHLCSFFIQVKMVSFLLPTFFLGAKIMFFLKRTLMHSSPKEVHIKISIIV